MSATEPDPLTPPPQAIWNAELLSEGAQNTAGNDGITEGDSESGSRVDVILGIDLPVVVRFGRTEMSIRELAHIGPGTVIDLGRSPDDPVELLVGDRVVARGEVVKVAGHYGIRVLDVVSPSERVRSMEA